MPWRISHKDSSSSYWEPSRISYPQSTSRLVSCLTQVSTLVSVRFWGPSMTSCKKFRSPMPTTETLDSPVKSLWGDRDQAWSSTLSTSWNSSIPWSSKFKTRLDWLDCFFARRMLDSFTRRRIPESKMQGTWQWHKRMITMPSSWVVGLHRSRAQWGTISCPRLMRPWRASSAMMFAYLSIFLCTTWKIQSACWPPVRKISWMTWSLWVLTQCAWMPNSLAIWSMRVILLRLSWVRYHRVLRHYQRSYSQWIL